MKHTYTLTLIGVGVFALFLNQPVCAWDNYGVYGNPAYDPYSAQLNAQMQQALIGINQELQNYESQNSEQLQALYQQYLQTPGSINIPYKMFVYNYLMSSGGTNPQAVINQQKAYTGAVLSNQQGLNEAFEGYLNSWNANQQSMDRIQQNWSNTLMGYSPYYNPYTGQTTVLPYEPSGYPGGFYDNGMGTYMYTPTGPYQVEPGGFAVPLEEMDHTQW